MIVFLLPVFLRKGNSKNQVARSMTHCQDRRDHIDAITHLLMFPAPVPGYLLNQMRIRFVQGVVIDNQYFFILPDHPPRFVIQRLCVNIPSLKESLDRIMCCWFGCIWDTPGCFSPAADLIDRHHKIVEIFRLVFWGISLSLFSIPGSVNPLLFSELFSSDLSFRGNCVNSIIINSDTLRNRN